MLKNKIKSNYLLVPIIATIFQYYDYALFGLLADKLSGAFVLDNYEGVDNSAAKLMNFYFILAVSVLSRPIGSYFFAHIGDKYGRSFALKIATTSIAVPSFIIAILPSYDSIGFAATILLFICRLFVIMFVTAEIDAVKIYVYENIGKEKRFTGNGIINSATQVGVLIAACVSWVISFDSMPEYAFRFAFVLSGVFGLVIYFLRDFFVDRNFKPKKTYEQNGEHFFSILADNKLIILKGIFLLGGIGALYQFHIIFLGTYYFALLKIVDEVYMKTVIMASILLYCIFSSAAGLFYDKFKDNAKTLTVMFLLLNILLTICQIVALAKNCYYTIFILLSSSIIPFCVVILPVLVQKEIKQLVRYRVYSIAHSLGSVILSSTTPLIAGLIWKNTLINWAPFLYFILLQSLILLNLQKI